MNPQDRQKILKQRQDRLLDQQNKDNTSTRNTSQVATVIDINNNPVTVSTITQTKEESKEASTQGAHTQFGQRAHRGGKGNN